MVTRLAERSGATLVGAALLYACGPNPSDTPFLREAGDHCPLGGCVDASYSAGDAYVPVTYDPLEAWDGGDGGPLTGIFAVEATVKAKVAGIEVQSKQLYRLRIFQDGAFVHQKTTLCTLTLPSVPNVATLIIPLALEAELWTLPNETSGDYLSNGQAIVGAQYAPPAFVEVVGANLANPATDPLPTMDAGTPTYDDAWHPGVTLFANTLTCTTTQALYVALRVTGALGGNVVDFDLIKGYAQVKLEDSVLGYSDPCLAVAATIKINVEPNSPFRAQRVGAQFDMNNDGNVDCPEIIDQAPAIFPDWNQ